MAFKILLFFLTLFSCCFEFSFYNLFFVLHLNKKCVQPFTFYYLYSCYFVFYLMSWHNINELSVELLCFLSFCFVLFYFFPFLDILEFSFCNSLFFFCIKCVQPFSFCHCFCASSTSIMFYLVF